MDYRDELWAALRCYLEDLGPVETIPNGLRIDVQQLTPVARSVDVDLTPEQWDNIVSIMGGGDLQGALDDVRRVLASGRHPNLVYCDYALVATWKST